MGSAQYLVDNWTIMGIISGTYAVDTFFFIGGLLACYLGMKYYEKKTGKNVISTYVKFDIPLMYLQRYIRFVTKLYSLDSSVIMASGLDILINLTVSPHYSVFWIF